MKRCGEIRKYESLDIEAFHDLLLSHLQESNCLISDSLAWDNITYAVKGLEFIMPVREVVRNGKRELLVLLSGAIEPEDKICRIKIEDQLEFEEIGSYR